MEYADVSGCDRHRPCQRFAGMQCARAKHRDPKRPDGIRRRRNEPLARPRITFPISIMRCAHAWCLCALDVHRRCGTRLTAMSNGLHSCNRCRSNIYADTRIHTIRADVLLSLHPERTFSMKGNDVVLVRRATWRELAAKANMK
jgi:hypothetical protein